MEYTTLTTEEKQTILENRIRQFEAEHYNNALNKANIEALNLPSEAVAEQIKQVDANLTTLESSITATKKELSKVKKAKPVE